MTCTTDAGLFILLFLLVIQSCCLSLPCGTATDQTCRIFLDHGGLIFHAEVFYPVAVLLTRFHWPGVNLTFVVNKRFAELSGLQPFWEKHSLEGVLGECHTTLHFNYPSDRTSSITLISIRVNSPHCTVLKSTSLHILMSPHLTSPHCTDWLCTSFYCVVLAMPR